MGGSLRDQLIKSGLATAEQARKAERQTRAEQNTRRQNAAKQKQGGPAAAPAPAAASAAAQSGTASGGSAPSSAHDRARQLNAEKAARDRAAQQVINAKAAEKALRAELKQLIHRNDQRTKVASDDDVPYNFLHGKKIKRIYISRDQQAALSAGSLVIVNDDGRYHLVAKDVAERVRSRDPKRIIAAHAEAPEAAPEPGSDDEYYARFKVPDDLDW